MLLKIDSNRFCLARVKNQRESRWYLKNVACPQPNDELL